MMINMERKMEKGEARSPLHQFVVSFCAPFPRKLSLAWKGNDCYIGYFSSYLKPTCFAMFFQANSSNQEALLNHAQEENHFYSFSSYLYPADRTHMTRKWLLAIGSKGRMRNAVRVLRRHKSHQFQITEIQKNTKTLDLSALFSAKRTKRP